MIKLFIFLLGLPERFSLGGLFRRIHKLSGIDLGFLGPQSLMRGFKSIFKMLPSAFLFAQWVLLFLVVLSIVNTIGGFWQPGPLLDYLHDCLMGRETFRLY